MTAARRVAAVAVLVAALAGLGATAALADATPRWDVRIEVGTDGTFVVTERITQRFDTPRHGILRYIPVAEPIAPGGLVEVPEGDAEDWFQRIRLKDIGVESTAPSDVEVDRPSRHDAGGVVTIRIGDPDRTVTGTHDYVVSYTIEGALLALDDSTTVLRWDVVGDAWQQPIDLASVTVTGPGLRTGEAECALGTVAGDPATACVVTASGDGAWSAATRGGQLFLAPMSVSVPFDAEFVPASAPILQRRFTVLGALAGDGRAWPLALLTAVVLGALLARLLYREGRDRVSRSDRTIDGRRDTSGGPKSDERPRRLFEQPTVPVEFRPPDGLRPAHLGLLVDERVDPVDVSATIVDLAVRGHLVIEEVRSTTLWWSTTDWLLRRTGGNNDAVERWEQYLLDGLFDDRDEVLVSDLKGTFSDTYGKVERGVYEDGRLRRWFAGRPDKVRDRWAIRGVLLLLLGVGLMGLLAFYTRIAAVAVPVVVAGLVLLLAHRRMPRRTPRGSALLVRTLGFRHFIETAESDRSRFAEQEHLFVEYLPYAVVFGATDKWARAFAGLGIVAAGGVGAWYVGSGDGFDAARFSGGLSDFSSTIGTAASAAPPSSSSGGSGGFSGGGGFGGGGGGSW